MPDVRSVTLASTSGGNDRRAVLRALLAVGLALPVAVITAWLTPSTDAMVLAPGVAALVGALIGFRIVAPRLVPEPASHFVVCRGDQLSFYPVDGAGVSGTNRELHIEGNGSGEPATALTLGGQRFVLAEYYRQVDQDRFDALRASSRGERFAVPYVQLRADANQLRAVIVAPTGRYSSAERPLF